MHAVLALFADVRRDDTIGRDLVVLAAARTVGIMGRKSPLDVTIEMVTIDNGSRQLT